MQWMKSFLVGSMCFTSVSMAGTFDCSVVYDEFDSLMNRSFIVRPGNYVSTQAHQMSRFKYNSQQKGKFKLKKSRKGYGIAMFRTNKNTYGKFLYTWGAPFRRGQPSLILKDVTKFGRVMDGYKKQVFKKIVIPSSYTLDLDTMRLAQGSKSDIWFHNVNGSTMFLEARNGANLHFPMESMCR